MNFCRLSKGSAGGFVGVLDEIRQRPGTRSDLDRRESEKHRSPPLIQMKAVGLVPLACVFACATRRTRTSRGDR
jgi:hypothetical protein